MWEPIQLTKGSVRAHEFGGASSLCKAQTSSNMERYRLWHSFTGPFPSSLWLEEHSIWNGDLDRGTHLLVLELVPSSLWFGAHAVSKADIDWRLFTGT